MRVEQGARTVVSREHSKGGAKPKDWGGGCGVGGGEGKEPPQKKSCWEERLSALPGPSTRAGLLTHHSASAKVLPPHSAGCLNPGPAGLTQWILSPKLKLLQNRNPLPRIPPAAPLPATYHLNSPAS